MSKATEPTVAEQVKVALTKKPSSIVPVKDLLSTGSTLLNLACSGKVQGAFAKGTYNLIVGDSNSGKSVLSTALMAEAAMNPAFGGYELIYDDVERAMLMNKEKFFGSRAAARIRPPAKEKGGHHVYSSTVEEMYRNVRLAIKEGKPFVYVVDSETSLSCEADMKRVEADLKRSLQKKKGRAKGEDEVKVGGSMGMEKAKAHSGSMGLRSLMGPLEQSGSILVIINQTRDNVGWNAQFAPKTRPGGNALEFFATAQIWLSIRQRLTANYKGKPVETGIRSRIKVKRTRLTGRESMIEVPIYWSSGIDDVGSMIDWLVEWKHWSSGSSDENAGGVVAPEFDFGGSREALVAKIQKDDAERVLQSIVAKVWDEIEAAVSVQRRSRYE